MEKNDDEKARTKKGVIINNDIEIREASDSEDNDDEPGQDDSEREEKTRRVITLMRGYFSETELSEADITNLIDECYRVCDRVVGEAAAIEWSKDVDGNPFKWPKDIGLKDEEELESLGGDLTKLIESKQAKLAKGRFSRERVLECVPHDYPEIDILLDIAQGVEIVVMKNFEPCPFSRGPLRQSYLRVAPAVNKVLAKGNDEGLNIIITSKKVLGKPKVNTIAQHWAKNGQRPEGRPISDSAAARNMRPEQAVNSKEGKAIMKARWGALTFPTIHDLALMVLKQAERVGWTNLRLWKADIRSAYAQLFVAAKDATLLVAELTDNKCVIHITSNYGFTGTGYAFGPVTRVILAIAGKEIAGGLEMYCDDLQGACSESELESEKAICYDFATRLLGPKAFALEGEKNKYKQGTRMEWIGWEFDLDERVVGLASKNFNKTLYEFFNVDVNSPVSLKTIERLAAFASRYSLIARPMRPFVHHLHVLKNTFGRDRNKSERRTLSPEARLDILMWRSFLVMMGLKRGQYWRKIESFARVMVTALLMYDSSLKGLGLRLFLIRPNGGMQLVRVASIIHYSILFGQDVEVSEHDGILISGCGIFDHG